MLGQKIGSGACGVIVGAVRSLDDHAVYVILVEERPGRYIVGTIRVGADGALPKEWDNGRYGLSFSRGWEVMGNRVAYARDADLLL